MKEYEIVCKYLNGCSGEAYPQISFEEAVLSDTDDYIREKHGINFEKFTKELLPSSQTLYRFSNGAITYIYEFTLL